MKFIEIIPSRRLTTGKPNYSIAAKQPDTLNLYLGNLYSFFDKRVKISYAVKKQFLRELQDAIKFTKY